jgi:hypothetical protein
MCLMDDIEEVRQALQLEDLRAAEHIYHALEVMSLTGIAVTKSMLDRQAAPTSAEITMQILKAKYN